jgi:serine/threonine protein kinase
MSPEVMTAEDSNSFDLQKTDIWSLGCTVVEMSSGSPPFPSPAVAVYQVVVKQRNPTPPGDDVLSDEGEAFLERCFCRDWKVRADTAELRAHAFCKTSENPEFLRTSTSAYLLEEVSGDNTDTFLSIADGSQLVEEVSSEQDATADSASRETPPRQERGRTGRGGGSGSGSGGGGGEFSVATLPSISSLSTSEWI